MGKRSLLKWEGFVEKVRFEPGKNEGAMNAESGDDEKDGLTMNEEVNGDKIGEADEINMEVYIAKN